MPCFLFTDIAGSTQLWEKYPDSMTAALARHDAILRRLLSSHGGIVVKHTGDGFFAVFPDSGSDCSPLSCAVDILAALSEEHWDDIGDLKAYERFEKKDKNGNVIKGKLVEVDSKNNIIISDKLVSLIGIENKIVAVTDDSVLVADKDRAQDVKKIVEKLKEHDMNKFLE